MALELIRRAVFENKPRGACRDRGIPAPCFRLRGGSYVVSGVPVVIDGLARSLRDALLVLLGIAVLSWPSSWSPSSAPGCACFPSPSPWLRRRSRSGSSALFGGSLTMASIAVLPILIGLAVDYAIQFQARFDEEIESGRRRRRRDGRRRRGGPDDRHRLCGDDRRASSPCCSRRPRWSAASAFCWSRRRDRLRTGPDGRLLSFELVVSRAGGSPAAGGVLLPRSGQPGERGVPPAPAALSVFWRARSGGPGRFSGSACCWRWSAGGSGRRSRVVRT